MARVRSRFGLGLLFLGLGVAGAAHAAVTYDDVVTPEVLFGAGNANGGFTVDRANGVELGLRGKVRFPVPANVFNSNGDGTYEFQAGIFNGTENPQWAFEWAINSNYDGTGGPLSAYTFSLEMDFDPGAGTNFLAWDHVSAPTAAIPYAVPVNPGFYDHSIGTNATANGAGVEAANPAAYAALLAGNNVAQNSWRYTFYDGAPYLFDANATGTYDIRLTAYQGVTQVAQVTIQILVDGFVTPAIMFGAGNANGGFTLDRANGVEVGLRAKVRFPVPMDVFNSNFDGTYTFLAGIFNGVDNPQWNFEWAVNTDYTGLTGKKVADYTYLLEMDFDPGAGTNFLAWDHVSSPTAPIPYAVPINPGFYDHSMGNNATANGAGVEAANPVAYAGLVLANNVVQNSWRYTFYDGSPYLFDATKIGRYDIRLTAFSGVTPAAQVQIQVKVVKAATCTLDSQCDDGFACNGLETCDLATNTCGFGTAVVCGGQCQTGTCLEPSGTCQLVPNGTGCAATPDVCTIPDTCQAGVCTDGGGGDADLDDLCSADDNCPADANTDQDDVDEDGAGDVCDANDAMLNVTRARIGRNKSTLVSKPNGRIKVNGDFIVDLPAGDALDVSGGLVLRVVDNLDLDTDTLASPPSWSAADCKVKLHGSGVPRVIQCKSANKANVAVFRAVNPISATQPVVYKFVATLRRLAIDSPFDEPVSVTFTEGAVDRIGTINDCLSDSSGLNCREG